MSTTTRRTRVVLQRPDRFYVGYPRSIAQRLLRSEYGQTDPNPSLLLDTIREVEYHGEPVPAQGVDEVFITVFDPDGSDVELPLDHPLADYDTLVSRRDDVRDVFLPDAYGEDAQMYRRELAALNRAISRKA